MSKYTEKKAYDNEQLQELNKKGNEEQEYVLQQILVAEAEYGENC